MRSERFEIEIDAPISEVWKMLTTPDGLASWFGTEAEIDLEPEGRRLIAWGEGVEMHASITHIEPETMLRVSYRHDGVETGAEEWLISRGDSVTRLTLINSMAGDGSDDWEGFYGDIRRGWRLFLASLRHALESASSPHRIARADYIPAAVERQQIWEAVESAIAGSKVIDDLDALILDEPHSRLYGNSKRTLLLDVEGHGDQRVLYAQAASHHGEDAWLDETLGLLQSALSPS